jgi:hypothetical protein
MMRLTRNMLSEIIRTETSEPLNRQLAAAIDYRAASNINSIESHAAPI